VSGARKPNRNTTPARRWERWERRGGGSGGQQADRGPHAATTTSAGGRGGEQSAGEGAGGTAAGQVRCCRCRFPLRGNKGSFYFEGLLKSKAQVAELVKNSKQTLTGFIKSQTKVLW
jgi:hypothetical protein